LGNWNDDGFTGSGNDHPLFSSHEIYDTIACNKRAAQAGFRTRRRRARVRERLTAPRTVLA
jgi:hypothetical protein